MTDTAPAVATAAEAMGPSPRGPRPSFARRHTGTLAAATAVAGFALGSFGAYRWLHEPPAPPIILRQALEPVVTFGDEPQPAAGGVLVLLRNDSIAPVVVIDAAFSRTTAAPPLYLAPAAVAPGADVEVFVAIPGSCQTVVGPTDTDSVKPVRIQVSAQLPSGPLELVPVDVTGELAAALQACGQSG